MVSKGRMNMSKRRVRRPLAHIHMELDFGLRKNKDVDNLIALLEGLKKRKDEHE